MRARSLTASLHSTRTSAPPPDPAATPCWPGRARTARRSGSTRPPPRPPSASGTVAGIGVNDRMPQAISAPSAMPIRQPIRVSVAASTRNWNMISPPGGAERLADADLPGALGHRDHHDRHHADAAHHEPHARQRDHHDEEAGGDLVEGLEHPVLGHDREVVRLRRAGGRAALRRAAVTWSCASSDGGRRRSGPRRSPSSPSRSPPPW